MSKALIAYFSATGTTQTVAEKLAAVSGYDLYEIKPTVPYTKKDLNWMNPLSRSTNEMKGRVPHPAIVTDDIRRVAVTKFRFILSAFTHLDNSKMHQYIEYSYIL